MAADDRQKQIQNNIINTTRKMKAAIIIPTGLKQQSTAKTSREYAIHWPANN